MGVGYPQIFTLRGLAWASFPTNSGVHVSMAQKYLSSKYLLLLTLRLLNCKLVIDWCNAIYNFWLHHHSRNATVGNRRPREPNPIPMKLRRCVKQILARHGALCRGSVPPRQLSTSATAAAHAAKLLRGRHPSGSWRAPGSLCRGRPPSWSPYRGRPLLR